MVSMFSLSDLAKGCMPIENPEATSYNEQGSDATSCKSELPVAEEENADTSYDITDLQTVSIPEELFSPVYSPGEISAHSDVPNIQISNVRRTYDKNAFVGEPYGNQIEAIGSKSLPTHENSQTIQCIENDSQTHDRLLKQMIKEVTCPMQAKEVKYVNQSTETADQKRELSAYHLYANETMPACQLDTQSGRPQNAPPYQNTANMAAPSYPMNTQDEMVNSPMEEDETSSCHQATSYQPEKSSSRGCESYGTQQRQTLHNCTSSCCCHAALSESKSSHTPVFWLADQRPSVIMEPVSQSSTASVESQVPSKEISEDSRLSNAVDEGGKEDKYDNYFRKNMDETTAQFELSEEDWDRIVITTYPRGGRLLAGDWADIFRNKLKESNPWCHMSFKNNHVISTNSPKMRTAPFFRGSGKCRLPECNVKVRLAIRKEKGKYVDVTYVGDICHKILPEGCGVTK